VSDAQHLVADVTRVLFGGVYAVVDREFPQLAADRASDAAADTLIDLVEDERRRLVGST